MSSSEDLESGDSIRKINPYECPDGCPVNHRHSQWKQGNDRKEREEKVFTVGNVNDGTFHVCVYRRLF